MFGFFLRRERNGVRQVLSRHMNRDFLQKFRFGKRVEPRGGFCQPVWIIPVDEAKELRFEEAFAVITKDICPEGMALIHTEPITLPKFVIALGEGERMDLLHCTVGHSTPIGLGFYQIGVHPQWVVTPRPNDFRRLHEHAAEVASGRMELQIGS